MATWGEVSAFTWDELSTWDDPIPDLIVMTGSGGVEIGGAADVIVSGTIQVTASGGVKAGGSATVQIIHPTQITASGGVKLGGVAPIQIIHPTFVTASGGVEVGGVAVYRFRAAPAPANVVIEWDFDNDGDFDETVEDITEFVVAVDTFTGRDWPSLLTGKAAPGKMKVSVRNDDNRFSFFNTSSPLNTGSNSLRTGRKIRLRTVESTNPDPTLYVRDRFNRTKSADQTLGVTETGQTWFSAHATSFDLLGHEIQGWTEGLVHGNVVNCGFADYYAQVEVTTSGTNRSNDNLTGLTFRYQDNSNFSILAVSSAGTVVMGNLVAGVYTEQDNYVLSTYDNVTLGIHVVGTVAHGYVDGVHVLTGTVNQTDETEVGLYGWWQTGNDRPHLDNFYVWSGLTAETEGILWTGDVSDVLESITLGPEKVAVIQGIGVMARAANLEFTPTSSPVGRKTGLVVGNTLAEANLLHPPGPIDEGVVTTGAFGYEKQSALETARQFEEAEFGFLYETQEGAIGFDSRDARTSAISAATFSDTPGSQLGYHSLEPKDWRGEIINRVEAGVAPLAPSDIAYATVARDMFLSAAYIFMIPEDEGLTDIQEGDLLIAMVTASINNYTSVDTGDTTILPIWITPPGWEVLDGKPLTSTDPASRPWTSRVFAKVAVGNEASQPQDFGGGVMDPDNPGSYSIALYRIRNWFGNLKEGVTVSDFVSGQDSGAIFPPWGPEAPSYLITALFGGDTMSSAGILNNMAPPVGYVMEPAIYYTDPTTGAESSLTWSTRTASVGVENPGAWAGTFSGWGQGYAATIAVRGPNGTPPIKNGNVTVIEEDTQSQLDHNSIRTHRDAANIFATEADATTYAQLVLDRYADDRPIFTLKFWAATTRSHRAQAIRRRVSDRITLHANNQTGLGITGDFFIESIEHRITNAGKMWETVWELSPAPE